MPPVRTATVARLLRSRSEAERAAFIADLWRARGYETERDGSVVVAERKEGLETERIWCGGGRPPGGQSFDTVIDVSRRGLSTSPRDARVLEPGDLRELLLYAVERDTARRLFESHFGRPLEADSPATPFRSRLEGLPANQILGVGLVFLLLVGVALGTSGAGLPFGDTGASFPAVPEDYTLTPDPALTTHPDERTGNDPPQGGGDLFRYPPGVGASGVRDAKALAAAHRTALSVSSWELDITHHRSHDLIHPYDRWTTAEQAIVRVNHTRYRFEVNGLARVGNDSIASVTYVDYGDGTANYRRLIGLHGHAFKRTQLPTERPPGVFATVSAAYVERFLATTESRVELVRAGHTTRTRVIATGTPTGMARTVANYTAVAVVDRRGVVHSLTVEYTLLERVPEPTPNGIATPYASPDDVPTEPVATVRFEMVLTELGTATLEPPSWYDTARNATNGTALPPWPNDPAI